MIHIDLFSGIGGFALAVDAVFDNVEHIFCEIDPYCQALLKKRFEGSVVYGDIRQLTADTYKSRCVHRQLKEQPTEGHHKAQRQLIPSIEPPFLLTGGFPCQPFSQAGKRQGTDDNRYLWPEMLRVIRAFQPTWVVAENVRGILTIEGGLVFEQVCLDLEREGYEVQPFVIPAVAKNAPHRRDRVWFVAMHTTSDGLRQGQAIKDEEGYAKKPRQDRKLARGFEGSHSHAPNTGSERLQGGQQAGTFCLGETVAHGAITERCGNTAWNKNWIEVATELCRVDDGVSAELDGLKLSKSRHRVERLKALGNAIVPQVAIEIMKAIILTNPTNRG